MPANSGVKLVFRPFSKVLLSILVFIEIIYYFLKIINSNVLSYIISDYLRMNIKEKNLISLLTILLIILILTCELLNFITADTTRNLLSYEKLKHINDKLNYYPNTLIIIPAYNEEKTILEAINEAKKIAKVAVIDDGSSDNTFKIALKHADYVVSHPKNLGLTQAIKSGIYLAIKEKFEYVAIFDADLQYNGTDLLKIITLINQNKDFDLVMGSRLKGRIEQMPFLKRIGNILFSKALTYLTKVSISDGQTGLRAFSINFAKVITLRSGFTYTQQMLFELARIKGNLLEIPIVFNKRKAGKSRLMKGAIDYAINAWKLNLRVITEHSPEKTGIFLIFLMTQAIILTDLTLNMNVFYISIFVWIIGAVFIILTLILYASVNMSILKDKEKEIIKYITIYNNN